MAGKKILFVDRDGTIINEPKDNFRVDTLDKLWFLPGAIENLYQIIHELNYLPVLVSNQDGLGTAEYPESAFEVVQSKFLQILADSQIVFYNIHIDKSSERENLPTRKPGTAMLTKYFSGEYDLKNSFMIGDSWVDMKLADNLGCRSIIYNNSSIKPLSCVALQTNSWNAIYTFLKSNANTL